VEVFACFVTLGQLKMICNIVGGNGNVSKLFKPLFGEMDTCVNECGVRYWKLGRINLILCVRENVRVVCEIHRLCWWSVVNDRENTMFEIGLFWWGDSLWCMLINGLERGVLQRIIYVVHCTIFNKQSIPI